MNNITLSNLLKTILSWLIPGILAGFVCTLFLTAVEYHSLAEMTGSVLHRDSVAEGLKYASEQDQKDGESYLAEYGYRRFRNVKKNLLPVTAVTILLSECAGFSVCIKRLREKKMRETRIEELTGYLKAAHAGEASALTRAEDEFSYLEDEIYKTVQALKSTEETAVKDHEILSERIADIAHQLKTPLTSMSLMTDLLKEYTTNGTEEYLDRLSRQIERLNRLVAGLLALARLDSHAITFECRPVAVRELLEEASEPVRQLLEEKNITLSFNQMPPGLSEEPLMITTDVRWTGEALLNVLKNCAEHTRDGGTIRVTYEQNPLYTQITVIDSGPGFLKKDLPHLFDRFYKGTGSAKDSAGIGLALARLILERQNGHILAENTSDGHARFQIRFYYNSSGSFSPAAG